MSRAAALDERRRPPFLERTYHDEQSGYRGYVVIDSLASGRANGGIRIRAGLTLDEIRTAARIMTWKYRFAAIPQGGAKAGVEGAEDLPRAEKARRLAWLADAASDLIDGGVYGIGPDLGTDSSLISDLLEQRGLLQGRRPFPSFRGSGYYTALTVVESAAVVSDLLGRRLRGARVAIEGFGAVGAEAARLLAERGARVVAISTRHGALHRPEGLDLPRVLAAADPLEGDPRAERTPPGALLEGDADLLLPCGPGGTIDDAVAARIRAPAVVPGANAALTGKAEEILHERGCLAVPSFVANCGGVASASLRVSSVPEWAIERLLRTTYPRRVRARLEGALRSGRPPLETVLAGLRPLPGAEAGDGGGGLLAGARRLVRSRWLPGFMFAAPAYLYLARNLGVPRPDTVDEEGRDELDRA